LHCAVIALVLAILPATTLAEQVYNHQQQLAEQIYQQGDYDSAYKKFRTLAKKGDHFSQFRISYMYFEGQALEADILESFAWAYLAAQSGQKNLLNYRDSVASLVPEDQQDKAMRKVDYYLRKWGNDTVASSRGVNRQCTGSRLGKRCDAVHIVEEPRFWRKNYREAEAAAANNASLEVGIMGTQDENSDNYHTVVAEIHSLNKKIEQSMVNADSAASEVTVSDTDSKSAQTQSLVSVP